MKRIPIYALATATAIGLTFLPPAAGQARGVPFLLATPHLSAAVFSPTADGHGRTIGAQPRPFSAYSAPDSPSNGGITLSRAEYTQFLDIARMSRAGALEVGLVNFSVKGTALFLGGIVWLGLMYGLRRIFAYWWDVHVCNNEWCATLLICVKLVCTAWVVTAMLG